MDTGKCIIKYLRERQSNFNGSNGANGAVNGDKSHSLEGTTFRDLSGCNAGFKNWHPTPVTQNGDKLAGQSDMGGLWEWTSSPLMPHDGFKAMDIYPGYTCELNSNPKRKLQLTLPSS